MKKSILNLGKNLDKIQQKQINGGQPLPDPRCKCFCYLNSTKYTTNCQSLCPNGDIPGVYEGTPASCFGDYIV